MLSPTPSTQADPAAPHAAVLSASLSDAIARHSPGWLDADRDDIRQTATIRVMLRLREVPEFEPTRAYVRRVARNAVIDAVRSHTARRHWTEQATCISRESVPSPEESLMGTELGKLLAEHMARLPEARREAIGLYVRGYGATEIATRLGCCTKRIENLLYRGLKSLRESLRAVGIEPS